MAKPKNKTYEIPIDFATLPNEADVDPWTRVEVKLVPWRNYINSLPVSGFSINSTGYDNKDFDNEWSVEFRVSESLSFEITRLKLTKSDVYYLKVTDVYLTDVNARANGKSKDSWVHFFLPHHIKIGKATGLGLQHQTVIPLLEKYGVKRLLGVDVTSLRLGSVAGAGPEEIISRPDIVEFNT